MHLVVGLLACYLFIITTNCEDDYHSATFIRSSYGEHPNSGKYPYDQAHPYSANSANKNHKNDDADVSVDKNVLNSCIKTFKSKVFFLRNNGNEQEGEVMSVDLIGQMVDVKWFEDGDILFMAVAFQKIKKCENVGEIIVKTIGESDGRKKLS